MEILKKHLTKLIHTLSKRDRREWPCCTEGHSFFILV